MNKNMTHLYIFWHWIRKENIILIVRRKETIKNSMIWCTHLLKLLKKREYNSTRE